MTPQLAQQLALRLQDVVVTHRGRVLVDVPELALERGRPLTVLGESGSGKSLLAHAVMGTLAPELGLSGRMAVDGTVLELADRRARRHLWGRTLALLPQEPALALDPTMRVGPQVAEGGRGDRRSRRSAAAARLAALGLAGEERAWPHTLSGGMAQRVAFAAATLGGAPVLLADEPSTGLDARARQELTALLLRHVTDGDGALLTITHDLDLARDLGGTVLVMRDATVVEHGPAEQVLSAPRHEYTRRLLAAEPGRWRHPWAHRAGAGRPVGQEVLRAEQVSVTFGRKHVLRDLDVSIRAGERVAVDGPSGSGKSTLGDVLVGLRTPDRGQVVRAAALAPGRVQKLYQDPGGAFPARVPLAASFRDVVRRHRVDPGRLEPLLDAVRLPGGLLQRRPGQVSGGELQRLAVARALLLEPALVFADEPTSRLDLITQEETVRCLVEQLEATGCALVLVTHDGALARAVADRTVPLGPEGGG